jgi:single-stranded DNA-binding protein
VARRRHLVLKVNVWRGQAEHLAESLGKGDRVMVTGRLRQRSWETPRATSVGHRHFEQPFDAVRAPGFGRGRSCY